IFNPSKPLELQACELNFGPGEEIEADGIVEPQAKLLEEWVQLKDRARQELEAPISTATVAEALIFDYEEILFRGCTDEREGGALARKMRAVPESAGEV